MQTIKPIVAILVSILALTIFIQNVRGQENDTGDKCSSKCDTWCCAACTRCVELGLLCDQCSSACRP
jgi:hypothetical protein